MAKNFAGLGWVGVLGVAVLGAGCSSSSTQTGAGGGTTTPQIMVTVAGAADTRLGATTQFTAAVTNTSNTAVSWQVNGITGGSTATGTISAGGLYTAPATLPTPATVTVGAVSQANSGVSSTLTEAIWNPVPTVTSAAATQTGSAANVAIDVQGTGFVPGAQIEVGGTAVATTVVSSTELQASVAPTGATTLALSAVNPNPGSAASAAANVTVQVVQVSLAAAARLLDQATFGPTLTDIQHVQAVGLDPYLNEQFAATPTLLADVPNPTPATCLNNPANCEQSEWWQAALTGPDQLRQRVAFALSEMFVVSTNSVSGYAVTPFQNLLVKDAFGNFSTVMHDVALSTAMGAYLNMLNSNKPATGQIANENFARENMQLFTIGLNLLNPNGTQMLDGSGKPIPSYTEAQVEAFARAYTGWTYATSTGGSPTKFPNGTANYDALMAPVESAHDTTAKILLNGTTLPAGQTAEQDLAGALGNIFAHPNVGPFVCTQLIQHLVASNPSPAYVGRVAAVFADNGSGVRGDMKAVVRAILEDPEARAGDANPAFDGGHLREPILYLANVMRGLGFVNTDPNGFYESASNYSGSLSERPYASPSVFNFFPPSYVVPGTTVLGPEFSLENTASAILRLSLANSVVYNGISGFKVDLSATSALGLMASNPGNLVDALGNIFLHGEMPTNMRTAIVNHITTLTDPAQRVRVATYLVITSSQYKVLH